MSRVQYILAGILYVQTVPASRSHFLLSCTELGKSSAVTSNSISKSAVTDDMGGAAGGGGGGGGVEVGGVGVNGIAPSNKEVQESAPRRGPPKDHWTSKIDGKRETSAEDDREGWNQQQAHLQQQYHGKQAEYHDQWRMQQQPQQQRPDQWQPLQQQRQQQQQQQQQQQGYNNGNVPGSPEGEQ